MAKLRARHFNNLEVRHIGNVQCNAGQKGKPVLVSKNNPSERKMMQEESFALIPCII
jgi:hypothetical protein